MVPPDLLCITLCNKGLYSIASLLGFTLDGRADTSGSTDEALDCCPWYRVSDIELACNV